MDGARILHFPIRLRCAAVADLLDTAGLEDAVARALGRQFARARGLLGQAPEPGESIVLGEPVLAGGGVAPEQADVLLPRIRDAIGRAARAHGLPRLSDPARGSAGRPADPKLQRDVSEPYDPARFDAKTATYEVPSYRGGKQKVPAAAKSSAFDPVLKRLDGVLILLRELMTVQEALPINTTNRAKQLTRLRIARKDLEAERRATQAIAAVLDHSAQAASATGPDRDLADELVRKYHIPRRPFPAPERLGARMEQLERGALLINTVRVRADELNRNATTYAAEEVTRDAFLDVCAYYLELLTIPQAESFERLNFLDAYYTDPMIIRCFAVIRYVRATLPMLWRNLKLAPQYVLGDLADARPPRREDNWTDKAIARAIRLQKVVNDQQGASVYGDLPKQPSELRQFPSPTLAAVLSAELLQLQVEVPVLRLWWLVQQLNEAMGREIYVGVGFFSGNRDRDTWTAELQALMAAFEAECRSTKHPGFEQNIKTWEDQVHRLHDIIYKEIRNLRIREAIGQQLPFLFVGAGLATGVAAWVAEVSNGSRWLIILAEAATLTAVNTVGAYAAGTRPTVGGVAIQFGTNLVFAGLGQVFQAFGKGVTAAEGLSNARRLLLLTSLKAGAFGSTTLLQTAFQAIEAEAHNKGGESSFTEMLTINLVMNALGLLFGAAFRIERGGGTGKELALPTPRELAAEYTAKGIPIDEQAAREWLDLVNRTGEFQARYQRLARAAQRGQLGRDEFENWRKEGLELADELARKLPRLAAVLGSQQTPAQIQAFLAGLRTALANASFTAPVKLLAQYSGMTHLGEGPTWVYDPATPPQRLAALRKAYLDSGLTVREIPGGGWEAVDAQGRVAVQALPAAPATVKSLPISLEAVAAGPRAQEGLARVRAQTAAPELPAQLALAAQRDRNAVVRLLQLLARGDAGKGDAVWLGVSSWLKGGGSPRTLARVAALAGDRGGAYAASVFERMATWDSASVAGLEAVLELRPRTTGQEIGAFLGDIDPREVQAILKDIGALRPAARESGLRRLIGQLFTEFQPPQRYRPGTVHASSQMRGARGVLATAIELMQRFPGKLIDFEVPGVTPSGTLRIEDVVIVDPVTGERLLGFEVKEVTAAFFGTRGAKQLSADIGRDAALRQSFRDIGVSRRPYEGFRWRVRRFEIEAQAIKQLQARGVAKPTPGQVDLEMRAMVREGLNTAFDQPEVRALPPAIRGEYRTLFDSYLPFVEFF
jgi:hypothetical protein